jgi:hypothetical protein
MFALPPSEGSADMAHYYFDLREGDELITDEEGLELRDMSLYKNDHLSRPALPQ